MADWLGQTVNFCFNVYTCTDPCRQTINKLDINHNSLKNKRLQLLGKMERVKSQITAAAGLDMIPNDEVTGWLQGAEGIVNRLNGILPEAIDGTAPRPLPQKCPGGCCYRNCCGTYGYAKEVEDMVAIVTEQITTGEFGVDTKMFRQNREAIQVTTEEDLVGMDDKFNQAWTFLRQQGFGSVGIHGMGGVGKTALLARIHNKLHEEDLGFDRDRIVRVDMSAVADIPSARLAIGKKLSLPGNEIRQGQIMGVLNQKKFVLLLDDLRDVKELDSLAKIGVPIEKNQNKSKVVFTTRYPEVCIRMGADQNIQLHCLEGEDPWILFQKVVRDTTLNSHEDIRGLAQKLANLCGGLPLALVTLGGSMRGKTSPYDWNLAIQRLTRLNPEGPEPYGMDEKVFKVLLEVSYGSLPVTHNNPCKSCFLYASLLPKTEEEELIHYWIAEEILKEFDELRYNLVHGRSMIESLKRSNLLNHSDGTKIVKMHDMIRGAALWIAKENFFVRAAEILDELPSERNWAEVERISLIGNSIQNLTKFHFGRLSTLILKKSIVREISYDFFDSMPSLRVLDMSWCNIDSLPKNITKLTTLQYLNISHTDISKLPTELQDLKKLKFLDLSYLNDLHLIPPQVLVSLSKLQSLNLYHSGIGKQNQESNAFPVDAEGNVMFASEGGNVLSGDGVALLKELEQLNHLDNLGLTVKSGLALQTLQKFKKLKCLHSLFITKCKELSSLQVPSLHTVQNLKVLRVHNCSDLEEFTICWNGAVVEEPNESSRMRRSFQNLRDIEIEGCWVLKNLSWLQYAPLLQLLKIDKCMKIEEVISNDENSSAARLEPNKDLFSKLRSLYLSNLPELKVFCNLALTLPVLEQITVLYCPKMKKLPLKAENANGTLKLIKINKNMWNTLIWEEPTMKSAFNHLCKFE